MHLTRTGNVRIETYYQKNKTFEFEVTKEYLTEMDIPRSGALREEKLDPDFRVMSM